MQYTVLISIFGTQRKLSTSDCLVWVFTTGGITAALTAVLHYCLAHQLAVLDERLPDVEGDLDRAGQWEREGAGLDLTDTAGLVGLVLDIRLGWPHRLQV